MKVKTLTGTSIHAALIEARRLLGDDVVLLESIPAEGDTPARITVMVDVPANLNAGRRLPQQTPAKPLAEPAAAGYGYARTQNRTQNRTQPRPRAVEQPQHAHAGGAATSDAGLFSYDLPPTTRPPAEQRAVVPATGGGPAAGRNRLYTGTMPSGSNMPQPAQALVPTLPERLEELLEAQLRVLHERLDMLDRRFESSIIGAGQRWMANVYYAKLLRQGMRPSTVTRLFDALITRGYEPDGDREKVRWALAQEIRLALEPTVSKRYNGPLMMIGPSGAGKTTTLLKLAKHPSFFGRHHTTVISIMPEDDRALPYLNPTDYFRQFGIPVQSVRTPEEMIQALDRAQTFEKVLIDTPPLPVHEAAARKTLQHLKRLVEPLMPLQVHLVLNATRALEDFDPDYLKRMPLQPDAVALTHLDETRSWGRIAEWMIQIQLPVQFASSSPRIPDGVGAFSPSWFVEEMMQLM
ncbi:MAG: flagellar biosynthesis protein FlhF [Rhodothermales bacterium]|nr:flagellar biosynthesis protein FlhF [Rhodothermales bacterium]